MPTYHVNRLLTATDCNKVLDTTTEYVSTLKFKKSKLERQLVVHHREAAKAALQLIVLKADRVAFNACLSVSAKGRPTLVYRCKLAKTEWRIQQMELCLDRYSEPALLHKELQLQQLDAALAEAELFITQVKERLAALLQEQQEQQEGQSPALSVLVQQHPSAPLLWLAPDLRQLSKPQGIEKLSQKRSGKNGLDALQVVNGYV